MQVSLEKGGFVKVFRIAGCVGVDVKPQPALAETIRMPLVNHAQQELHIKLVYYGPGLGGKTTNLEYIHQNSNPEHRGKFISLDTASERTLFFDLLPVNLGKFRGYTVRLHLCTVPGQIAFDKTRQLVLRNVDGVVFVVDSQRGQIDPNLESIQNLYENLQGQGVDPDRLPLVVQFNKRDLPGVVPVSELTEVLHVPEGIPVVPASALSGKGVLRTLKLITKACLRIIGDPAVLPEGRSPSILPGQRTSMYRQLEPVTGSEPFSLPRPSRVPGDVAVPAVVRPPESAAPSSRVQTTEHVAPEHVAPEHVVSDDSVEEGASPLSPDAFPSEPAPAPEERFVAEGGNGEDGAVQPHVPVDVPPHAPIPEGLLVDPLGESGESDFGPLGDRHGGQYGPYPWSDSEE